MILSGLPPIGEVAMKICPILMFAVSACLLMANDAHGQSGATASQMPYLRGIDFFAEEIELTIADTLASVKGTYYFRNGTQKRGDFPVIFPFYTDSLIDFPVNIEAYIEGDSARRPLYYRIQANRSAVMIGIPMTPDSVTIWHLDYSQVVCGNYARYILSSTGAWSKPLEEAIYRFIVPAALNNVRVWPEPDSIITGDSVNTLVAHKKAFMPRREMEISWQRK